MLDVLQNVVIVLIPSLNPDGERLVTEWYDKNKGTQWEGGPMPWLYQKYAGHDINRDAFMLNLAENRNLARFMYSDWHPQVFLTMHQMEDNGPRFFVPPNTDPIDPNSDPLIWRSAALLGGAMALELQRTNRKRERLREKITRAGGAGFLSTDSADLLGLGELEEVNWAVERVIADNIATRAEIEKVRSDG